MRFNLLRALSLSPLNAGAARWRWWCQSWPLAIRRPRPIKFLVPCCCSHDLPLTPLCFISNSFINSVSVKQSRGSVPFHTINLFPGSPKQLQQHYNNNKKYQRLIKNKTTKGYFRHFDIAKRIQFFI